MVVIEIRRKSIQSPFVVQAVSRSIYLGKFLSRSARAELETWTSCCIEENLAITNTPDQLCRDSCTYTSSFSRTRYWNMLIYAKNEGVQAQTTLYVDIYYFIISLIRYTYPLFSYFRLSFLRVRPHRNFFFFTFFVKILFLSDYLLIMVTVEFQKIHSSNSSYFFFSRLLFFRLLFLHLITLSYVKFR